MSASTSKTEEQQQSNANGSNGVVNGTASDAPKTPPVEQIKPMEPEFRVGWSYDVYLRKNSLPPSVVAGETWKRLSREASKVQMARMAELSSKGFKTSVKRSAVWNNKAKCYDTALTARVVEPDCTDADLIRVAYIKAQARQAKLISAMRAAAIEQGAQIGQTEEEGEENG